MKKLLPAILFILITVKGYSQQFSQYNTGTLYDSFENPSQKTFKPDTGKMFASNFFTPNFNLNFYLSGDAQTAAKTRLYSSYYNTADLKVGQGKNNHINANINAYLFMFKMYSSTNGDVELGLSLNTKVETRGLVSDETVALFNGTGSFPANSYDNIFNDNFYTQVYQQIGLTYREQITDRFAIGLKFNALSGVSYDKVQIDQSHIDFDKPNDAAALQISGTNYSSSNEGRSFAQNLLPTFRNPGASVTIGTSLKTWDGFTLQGNIKDLGFIHWNNQSTTYKFNNFGSPVTINGLSTSQREDSIYNKAQFVAVTNQTTGGFTTVTNGLLELSANKSWWLGDNETVKFSPTLILSKELFYSGLTGALVAPFQYHNYSLSLTSTYNDLNLFSFGAQFMIKSDESEFFIGSERLFQTISFIKSSANSSVSLTQPQVVTNPTGFTGMDFYIGFSLKFGPLIEHRMNASSVPDGEKGFIGRLWEKIFPGNPISDH